MEILNSQTCTNCHETKQLDRFQWRIEKGKTSKYRLICKDCINERSKERYSEGYSEYHQKYRAENREKLISYLSEYREKNRDRMYAQVKQKRLAHLAKGGEEASATRRKNHAGKPQANDAVKLAIRSGKLHRPCRCEECQTTCKPHAHHDSYLLENHLKVRWLCSRCHKNFHSLNETITILVQEKDLCGSINPSQSQRLIIQRAVRAYPQRNTSECIDTIDKDIYIRVFEKLDELKVNYLQADYGQLIRGRYGISGIVSTSLAKQLSNLSYI